MGSLRSQGNAQRVIRAQRKVLGRVQGNLLSHFFRTQQVEVWGEGVGGRDQEAGAIPRNLRTLGSGTDSHAVKSRPCASLSLCQIPFVISDGSESPLPLSADFRAGCPAVTTVCSRL